MLDHVACDQHKAAMSHLRTAQAKASSKPVTSYALIIIMSKKWCQTTYNHSWKWSEMLSGHLQKLYLSLWRLRKEKLHYFEGLIEQSVRNPRKTCCLGASTSVELIP